jgi:DNA-binding MarR family transcriptional regulator
MVTRERNPRDVRALAVSLTAKGRRIRARAERIPPAIVARLGMSLGELEELRDGLTRVIAASGDERVSPEPGE